MYWFAWCVAFIAALVTTALLRGRTGRAFEAIRNDELAAEAMGVATRRAKIAAFAYSGALAALGGAIFASFLGLVNPDAVGIALSVDFLLMVVLGGSGLVSGALVGAALIGFANVDRPPIRQLARGRLRRARDRLRRVLAARSSRRTPRAARASRTARARHRPSRSDARRLPMRQFSHRCARRATTHWPLRG